MISLRLFQFGALFEHIGLGFTVALIEANTISSRVYMYITLTSILHSVLTITIEAMTILTHAPSIHSKSITYIDRFKVAPTIQI